MLLLPPATDRVVPTELGYGVDLSCVTDLTPTLEEVDPRSQRAISEAVVRRYITPRGGVIDDQAYGLDLRSNCNRGITTDALNRLAGSVRAEAKKDDRVEEADATIRYDYARARLPVQVTLTAKDLDEEFDLVFFVTADGIQLAESINKHG
jgi:hypothetical protein